MKAVVIKEAYGLWSLETTGGVLWTASSLPKLLAKAIPGTVSAQDVGGCSASLSELFKMVKDSGSGQVGEGVLGS